MPVHHTSAAQSLTQLGMAQLEGSNFQDAIQYFNQALSHQPDHAGAVAGKAMALDTLGQIEKALALIGPYLREVNPPLSILTVYGRLSHRTGNLEKAIQRLEQGLQNQSKVNPIDIADACFQLGALYNECKEYGKAFLYYKKANELKSSGFAPQPTLRLWNDIKSIFSKKILDLMPVSNLSTSIPIFVVGMPRSGTSLVENILDSHPQVVGAGEMKTLPHIVEDLPSSFHSPHPYPICMKHVCPHFLDKVGHAYLRDLTEKVGNQTVRAVDKMPANFQHLGLISLVFPKARIIHCRRNPIDTCLSCYFQNFTGNSQPFSNSLADLIEIYRGYESLMQHWSENTKISLLHMQYEELVQNPVLQAKKMLGFCGLSWEPACLEFYKSGRVTNTASYHQVQRPVYQTSVNRYRHYEQYIPELITAFQNR